MKHIDIKSYLEAATSSEEAWYVANDKLEEFELKIKELDVIKNQFKMLLDNVSMSSSHLRSLIMDLEKYYVCMCGKLEDHPSHDDESDLSIGKGTHEYVNAHEFRSENE